MKPKTEVLAQCTKFLEITLVLNLVSNSFSGATVVDFGQTYFEHVNSKLGQIVVSYVNFPEADDYQSFFASGFSFANIHYSQDSRRKGRLFL